MIRARLYRVRPGTWEYVVGYGDTVYLTDTTGSMAALVDQCRSDVAVLTRWVRSGNQLGRTPAYMRHLTMERES